MGCLAQGAEDGWVTSPDLGPRQQQALERLNALRGDPRRHRDDFERLFEAEERAGSCGETKSKCLNPLKSLEKMPPLAPSGGLSAVAQAHAVSMAEGGWFDHVGPDGLGPNERVRRAGIELDAEVPVDGRIYRYGPGQKDNQVESIYQHGRYSTGTVPDAGASVWSAAVDSLVVDRCVPDRGHRDHLMGRTPLSARDREVGLGAAVAKGSHPRDASMKGWTQRLVVLTRVRTDDLFYVLGSVSQDLSGDGAFQAGEQLADVQVTIPELGLRTRTASGGGFVFPVRDGATGTVVVDGQSIPFEIEGANTQVLFRK